MQQLRGLLLNRCNNARLAVADIHDADAASKIDDLSPIGSGQDRAAGRRYDGRRNHWNATGRHGRTSGDQIIFDFHAIGSYR